MFIFLSAFLFLTGEISWIRSRKGETSLRLDDQRFAGIGFCFCMNKNIVLASFLLTSEFVHLWLFAIQS